MKAQHTQVGEIPAVVLGNDAIEVTILAGKGADILSMRDLRTGIDPLWKARWGAHHSRSALNQPDSLHAWLSSCAGGWNTLFPGGGAESVVGGAIQPMHGESSIIPWDVVHLETSAAGAEVRLVTHLSRSPFCLERHLSLSGDLAEITVTDTAVNEGGESFPYTWTHHPTLGSPFLDAHCVIETNAVTWRADDTYDLPHIPLPATAEMPWSEACAVLGKVPAFGEPRQLLSYLDFADSDAWYRIVNPEHDLAFELAWSSADMPHAWFFQEMCATPGWPWFSNTYIMAIEPSTTWPGRGLAHAVAEGRAAQLGPGESRTIRVTASLGSAR